MDAANYISGSGWTADIVKECISTGQKISSATSKSRLFDIGDNIVVKYGPRVRPEEANATQFVADSTSIRVPKIHAVVHDDADNMTYIVQEKLLGSSLLSHLPSLDTDARAVITEELKHILLELSTLDTRGPMGLFERPSLYDTGRFSRFIEYYERPNITTTKEFVDWLPGLLEAFPHGHAKATDNLASFDYTRPQISSHGDFVPQNILVQDGHVSGIIDWEYAGWYPYFWNDCIARWWVIYQFPKLDDGRWEEMLTKIMTPFPTEAKAFIVLHSYADMYL
ncbi:kinase-like protein [Mycena galericulata]|nr:kinase-like protein [Mycena galericulata]